MSGANKHREPVGERDLEIARVMRGKSRRGFLIMGISATAGFAGWTWLTTRPELGGLPYPLRRALEFNERIAESYFKAARLAPTFPREMAREPRVNGGEGLPPDFDPSGWSLRVRGAGESRQLALEDIKQLPRVEMTTELKCIEGWSVIVNWAGCRFSDFVAEYLPADPRPADNRSPQLDLVRYVGLATPDGEYYVGMDMPSALHPQTLLCYEMNGEPLSIEHGAPLRLVTTVKYGIKSIKRIGTITFTDRRPSDFWAERGYDWYAGH
jgi:DMSO/TMAO reductase YedYZ molybdopterin-dependent catalytic subunit